MLSIKYLEWPKFRFEMGGGNFLTTWSKRGQNFIENFGLSFRK